MADTHGFEVVAELGPSFLRKVLRAAWKSGGDDGTPGVIPEFFPIPGGQTIGPFTIQGGQVQLPQNELDVSVAPSVNGLDVKLGLHLQVQIQNPPVPSASLFTMTADAHALAPIGTVGSTVNVGLLLNPLPAGNVTATLTSGDPVAPHIDDYLREFVHSKYETNGTDFPHTVTKTHQPLSYFGVTAYYADEFIDIFDDPGGGAHSITVQRQGAPPSETVAITIPLHFRISNILKQIGFAPTLADPMGADAELIITAPFESAPGSFTAHLSTATATAQNITPGTDQEGVNYSANKAALAGTLDSFVATALSQQGLAMAHAWGDTTISYPTASDIEAFIAEAVRQKLEGKGNIPFWQPQTGPTAPVQINNVTPKALAGAVAIAVNSGPGADANALGDFIPGGREFAIALSSDRVLTSINDAIHRPESQGGFGPSFPPKHFDDVNGHEADLTRLDISLTSGAIHLDGDVTVIDAIAWSIDIDASFTDDVGLKWVDDAGGSQHLAADPADPDVDLSLAGWIIAFILGVLTGPIGFVIVLVVFLVAESTADSVGSSVVKNSVSHEVEVLGALPPDLLHIGTIDAKFENPVGIDADGIVFAG